MVDREAKVKLQLDTSEAKAELAALTRSAAAAGKRAGSMVKGALGAGLHAVGLGAGIGLAKAAIRGPTETGLGAVVGESLGGIGKDIEKFFLGDLPEKARADRAAREDAINAFGAIAGRSGAIPPGAKQYFDQVQALRLQEEKGRTLFERSGSGFRSSEPGELIDRIMDGIGKLLSEAVDRLASMLNPFD